MQLEGSKHGICKRSGKIIHINILTEWGIMGFCFKRLLEIEVIKTIELLI